MDVTKRNILHLWIKLLLIYGDTQPASTETFDIKKTALLQLDSHIADRLKKSPKDKLPERADEFYKALDAIVRDLPNKDLDAALASLPQTLELRTAAVTKKPEMDDKAKNADKSPEGADKPPSAPKNKAPVIITHSALGTLNYAVSYHEAPGVEIVTPEIYRKIVDYSWNHQGDTDFYTLARSDLGSTCNGRFCYREKPVQNKTGLIDKADPNASCMDRWIAPPQRQVDKEESLRGITYLDQLIGKTDPLHKAITGQDTGFETFSPALDTNEFYSLRTELDLARLRRYVLIVIDTTAPPDAYVSYQQYGYTYYIDGNDRISRKNLALLSQIMTMQAIPSASPALTPSINVGAQ